MLAWCLSFDSPHCRWAGAGAGVEPVLARRQVLHSSPLCRGVLECARAIRRRTRRETLSRALDAAKQLAGGHPEAELAKENERQFEEVVALEGELVKYSGRIAARLSSLRARHVVALQELQEVAKARDILRQLSIAAINKKQAIADAEAEANKTKKRWLALAAARKSHDDRQRVLRGAAESAMEKCLIPGEALDAACEAVDVWTEVAALLGQLHPSYVSKVTQIECDGRKLQQGGEATLITDNVKKEHPSPP
eukprot:GHVT01078688.1.p1 GENE.GHVT01078688.1~~GHVT01078688.1.p1  ORF type:complete len:252 (+),score=49.31 GHVT01078688.1:937-1692(+)